MSDAELELAAAKRVRYNLDFCKKHLDAPPDSLLHEFGRNLYDMMVHKQDDGYVFSWYGCRIFELYNDGKAFLVVPPTMSQGLVKRWEMLVGERVYFRNLKARSLGTEGKRRIELHRNTNKIAVNIESRAELFVDPNARDTGCWNLRPADSGPTTTIVRDSDNYKAMKKHMRELSSVMRTQIRMGLIKNFERTYGLNAGQHMLDTVTKWRDQAGDTHSKLRDSLTNDLVSPGDSPPHYYSMYGRIHKIREKYVYWFAMLWRGTKNPVFLTMCCEAINLSYSSVDVGQKGLLAKVKNAMNDIRKRYFQDNCVSITSSDTSLKEPSNEDGSHNQRELYADVGL